MGLEHHVARIFGAAVVAVALCLAPTLAVAHAGHQHPAAHAHAATVDVAPAAHHTAAAPDHQPTAALIGAAELRTAAGPQANAPAPHCCDGQSCCFGMACCSLALAPEQPAIAPPILSSSLSIADPPG